MKRFLISSLMVSTLASGTALAEPMDDISLAVNPSAVKAGIKIRVGEILQVIIVANSNEVKASRVALKRASRVDVRKFAELMIQDHGQNLQATKNLAEALHVRPVSSELSENLAEKGAQGLQKLESAPARWFDKFYMEGMVESQRKLLNVIVTDLLPNATNPNVITQLNATRDKVIYHLKLAKQIQNRL